METSLSAPLSYLCLLGVLISFFLLVMGIRKRRWPRILLLFSGSGILVPSILFFLALNAWTIDSRFRTFRSFFYDIEKGMTRTQVLELVDKHYPEGGPRHRPITMQDEPDDLGFFMNTEEKAPSCEGIFLNLRDGIVVGKAYSND